MNITSDVKEGNLILKIIHMLFLMYVTLCCHEDRIFPIDELLVLTTKRLCTGLLHINNFEWDILITRTILLFFHGA